QVFCAMMVFEFALLGGGAMNDYELYAISTFVPNPHQTRVDDAKRMATGMLEEIANGARICCSACEQEFVSALPPAVVVLMPKNQELRSIGGWLWRPCLNREDPLETLASAFGRVVPT